jgi:hypothetical protein
MNRRTLARLTGLAYGAMIPGGIAGFLTARPGLFDPDSAANTLANLLARGDLALIGVLGNLTVILAQALAAIGFYALLRERHPVSAFGVAGFGLVNCAAILTGAAASWAALLIAPTLAPEQAPIVQALYLIEGNAWSLGNLFFGLWLIPMGWAAWRSGEFHAGGVLGRILIGGGVLYAVGAVLSAVPAAVAAGLPDLCAMPATVGELWMVGALLVVGVRQS